MNAPPQRPAGAGFTFHACLDLVLLVSANARSRSRLYHIKSSQKNDRADRAARLVRIDDVELVCPAPLPLVFTCVRADTSAKTREALAVFALLLLGLALLLLALLGHGSSLALLILRGR